MSGFVIERLLETPTASVWDACCSGAGEHPPAPPWRDQAHLLLPYRGLFVRHRNDEICVAEAGQVLLCNADDECRITHPVPGGDSSLVLRIEPAMLREIAPAPLLCAGDVLQI